MWVTQASRKSRSCETSSSVPAIAREPSSSHSTASRSRWLVGSSSSSRSERAISACARLRRMRQPPEKLATGCARSHAAKPRPASSDAARARARVAVRWPRSGRAARATSSPSCDCSAASERRSTARSSVSPSSTNSIAALGERRRLLRDRGDAPVPWHVAVAGFRVQLAAQQREEARLAAAVRPDEADAPARMDLERRVLDQSARTAGEGQVLELNHAADVCASGGRAF